MERSFVCIEHVYDNLLLLCLEQKTNFCAIVEEADRRTQEKVKELRGRSIPVGYEDSYFINWCLKMSCCPLEEVYELSDKRRRQILEEIVENIDLSSFQEQVEGQESSGIYKGKYSDFLIRFYREKDDISTYRIDISSVESMDLQYGFQQCTVWRGNDGILERYIEHLFRTFARAKEELVGNLYEDSQALFTKYEERCEDGSYRYEKLILEAPTYLLDFDMEKKVWVNIVIEHGNMRNEDESIDLQQLKMGASVFQEYIEDEMEYHLEEGYLTKGQFYPFRYGYRLKIRVTGLTQKREPYRIVGAYINNSYLPGVVGDRIYLEDERNYEYDDGRDYESEYDDYYEEEWY